jgi:3-methyladenine DNA glycosylase Mpg
MTDFDPRAGYGEAMSSKLLVRALHQLSPSAETDDAACGSLFGQIAELLLNRTTLFIAQHPYRITEIELYYHGLQHLDPFTHNDPMQQQLGAWYFHRSGTQYRSGTYKGLDIAFGSAEAFGGILLRGIESLAGSGPLIDGPCNLVDHILASTASPSIATLVSRFDATIEDPTRRSPLHLALDAHPRPAQPIYATPRIGLTIKKGNTPARRRFIARPYRFLSEPARIRKGKPHLITSLHQHGHAPAQIAALTRTRLAVVQGYLDAFEAGPTTPLESLRGDLSPAQTCQLLGACAAAEASTIGAP